MGEFELQMKSVQKGVNADYLKGAKFVKTDGTALMDKDGKEITLDYVKKEMEDIRYDKAIETGTSQFDISTEKDLKYNVEINGNEYTAQFYLEDGMVRAKVLKK